MWGKSHRSFKNRRVLTLEFGPVYKKMNGIYFMKKPRVISDYKS
jgi:hypothetical protein